MPHDAPASTTPTRQRAYALLPLLILLWGANWAFVKIGLQYISPLWFSAIRVGFGSLCLFAFLGVTGRLERPTRRDWPVVASVGILQMAIFLPLTNYALQFVPAGRAAVLVYTTPLWVTPGAVVFLGERLNRVKLTGLAFGLAGIAVLFNPRALDWSNHEVVVGSMLLMLSAMIWSISILHIRGHRWHLSALQITPWQLAAAFVTLTPMALALESFSAIRWNATLTAVILYNGPITTGFCFWAAILISQALPAVTSSISFLAVPAVGIATSLVMLGERPDVSLLAGFGLILVGVTLVNLSDWHDPAEEIHPV